MPVRPDIDFESLQLDDYEAVCPAANFPTDWPDGLRAHGALEVAGRLSVVDVWDSREQFDRFLESRLQRRCARRSASGPRRRRSRNQNCIRSARAGSPAGTK